MILTKRSPLSPVFRAGVAKLAEAGVLTRLQYDWEGRGVPTVDDMGKEVRNHPNNKKNILAKLYGVIDFTSAFHCIRSATGKVATIFLVSKSLVSGLANNIGAGGKK